MVDSFALFGITLGFDFAIFSVVEKMDLVLDDRAVFFPLRCVPSGHIGLLHLDVIAGLGTGEKPQCIVGVGDEPVADLFSDFASGTIIGIESGEASRIGVLREMKGIVLPALLREALTIGIMDGFQGHALERIVLIDKGRTIGMDCL